MVQEENIKSRERPPKLGGGPLGLGDPDDLSLRKTEKDVIIPKLIREEARKRCPETVKLFLDCSKNAGLLVGFKCKEENKANNECMLSWATNPEFINEMTDKYLKGRSHYRRTGEPLERYNRSKKSSTSLS